MWTCWSLRRRPRNGPSSCFTAGSTTEPATSPHPRAVRAGRFCSAAGDTTFMSWTGQGTAVRRPPPVSWSCRWPMWAARWPPCCTTSALPSCSHTRRAGPLFCGGGGENVVAEFPSEPDTAGDGDAGSHAIYAPTDRPAFVDRSFIQTYWANSLRFPHGAFEAYARSIGHESPRILNERFNIGGSGLRLERPEQLGTLPILVMTGDADPRHPKEVDGALATFLGADFIWLPDIGITGNGHMLMLEDNHEQLAAHIGHWLDQRSL